MFGRIFCCWCLGRFWQDLGLLVLLDRRPLPLQLRRRGGDRGRPWTTVVDR